MTWRDRYMYFEFETRRRALTTLEIEQMTFHFNFTPPAGGRYVPYHTATHRNTLPCTATHCNTPQHTATHCNTQSLQRSNG